MDGRRNNKGTPGNKGGRPPKADEIKLIEQMDAIAAPSEAWAALWAKVQDGDTQAIKTWLEYRFGKPKQQLDVTTDGEKINVVPSRLSIEVIK
jgi:acetylornithine deacetylase/succinyl-diaminopimelate desuccinylase-like protein